MLNKIQKYGGVALEFLCGFVRTIVFYKVDIAIVDGTERYTGQHIRVLYIGSYRNYTFLFTRMCTAYRVSENHTHINPFYAKKWIKKYRDDVDLLFADIEFPYCTLLRNADFIAIPQWVKQKLALQNTWEEVINGLPRKTRREVFRQLRKFGFTYSITKVAEDLNNFYHHMYVPYIRSKFKEESMIVDKQKFLEQSKIAELLQLRHNDKVIAGALLQKVGKQLSSVWIGYVEDIDPAAVKGVSDVLDYFTIFYGYNSGCRVIDFGPSRPLLNDGVFRYKDKWGTYVYNSPIPTGDILFKPLHFNRPMQSFLAHNSFIARDGRELVARLLFSERTVNSEDLERTSMNHPKGLYRMKIFSLAGFDDDAYRWAMQHTNIKLLDLSNIEQSAEAYCRF